MSKLKDLKVDDSVLLTYKGSEYEKGVRETSILGIVESLEISEIGEKSVKIKVISDNATTIVFAPGQIAEYSYHALKKTYTYKSELGKIIRRKNPSYVELKII